MSRTGDLLRERKEEREGAALSSRTQTLLNERFGTSASAAAGDQAAQTDWPTQNTTPSVTQADGVGEAAALKSSYLTAKQEEDAAWEAYNKYNNSTHWSQADQSVLDGLNADIISKTTAREEAERALEAADKGDSGNFFTKLGGLYTASMNMRQASEMSIYGGKKADAVAEQLDTRAEQMITSAKPEVSYVGERGAVGAAQSAEGIVNALGYMGQALSRTRNLQASQDAAMWGAVTGSGTQKVLSERLEQTALDSAREGLQDTVSFGDEYDEKVEQKYADADISKLGRGAAVVSEGIGGMLPYIASGALGGLAPAATGLSGTLSTAAMFFSGMGNATQEAKREGYDDLRAMAYGSAVGAVEVATERMFDGMAGIFGKGAFDDVVRGTIRNVIKNEGVQKAVGYVVGMGGEGVEEFFAELGTRVANELTINNDDRTLWQTFQDGGKSALVGALISGIMQAGGNVAQIIRTDPAKAARQAAHAVIAEVHAGRSAVQAAPWGTVPEGRKNAPAGAEAEDYYFDEAENNTSWRDRMYTEKGKTYIQSQDRQRMYEVPSQNEIGYEVRDDGAVVLSDDVLSNLSPRDYRDFAKAYAELNLVTKYASDRATISEAKPVTVNSTGNKVIITQTGISEYAKKLRGKGIKNRDNVSSVLLLNKLIEYANPISTADNIHSETGNPFTYYKSKFEVGGRMYGVTLHIKNVPSGDHYYYHALDNVDIGTETKKVTSTYGSPVQDGEYPNEMEATISNTTISQAVPGVNGQYLHNAPSVFLPGSGLEGLWTVGDGMLPVDEKLAQTSRWLLPVDEKLAERSMLPLSEGVARMESERLRAVGLGSGARKGTGSGGGSAYPGKPVQTATVDFADKGAVMQQLKKAEEESTNLDYEVNVSVTTDGKVWRVSGESSAVNPGLIPSDIQGSYAYHNHPKDKTWYSFSADDAAFFISCGEAYSKASDHLYEYVMRRRKDTLAGDFDTVYNRFKEIEKTDVLEMKWNGLIDPDYDGYHETMKILSKEYRFDYTRREKNGRQ